MGVEGICPPLCTYKELKDGTYNLSDVLLFNMTIEDLVQQKSEAIKKVEMQMRG